MKRFDIIQHLIDTRGYKRYLEIGVAGGDAFSRINVDSKESVDPNSHIATHKMTSDQFFLDCLPEDEWDIIFIDGLHLKEQVTKDILNSLAHLREGGTIVVHDCLPDHEHEQVREQPCGRPWTGDVWKAFAKLRMTRPDLEMFVIDTDCGCGIIRRGSQALVDLVPDEHLDWNFFVNHSNEVLNVKAIDNWS